ncbi:hypothetical protein [Aliarcobacter butzleri]|uniref:hypothetical protein n=1 Tax=Aliarcobacter butzleri TaxID=28197 RepID=UPI00130534DE|nr:hypothetical protein [Aliarcobacter butzleri]
MTKASNTCKMNPYCSMREFLLIANGLYLPKMYRSDIKEHLIKFLDLKNRWIVCLDG